MASGTVTVVLDRAWLERNAPKVRAGVDKGRPIASVADSIKKFSSSPEPKRAAAAKPKPPTQKPSLEQKQVKPAPQTDKPAGAIRKSTPVSKASTPAKPAKPAVAENKPRTGSFEITSTKTKAPTSKAESSENMEVIITTEVKLTPVADPEPVVKPEPPPEVSTVPSVRDISPPKKSPSPEPVPESDKERDTTRALKIISKFEQKANPQETDTPPWKKHLKEREGGKDESNEPKETKPVIVTRVSPARSEPSPPRSEPPPPVTTAVKEEEKEKEKEKEKKEKPVANGELTKSLEAPSPSKGEDEPDGFFSNIRQRFKETSSLSKSTSVIPSESAGEEVKLREKKTMGGRVSSQSDVSDGAKKKMVNDNKRSSWMPSKREECAACGKVVYAMERLEADKVVYHKTCFKCVTCNKTLSTGNYAALQGKTYCKVHFKQLFKMKGNYDEGFGREQHKTKWIKKDGDSSSSLNGH